MNTKHYEEFVKNVEKIQFHLNDDDLFINNLLFANAITIFEVYLQSIFIDLLSNYDELLENLTLSNKYKNNKISLNKALTNDIKVYLKELVKNIVFHNLSDVEPLFKEVLGVFINYKSDEKIITFIEKRHDIIHRNGITKNGLLIEVKNDDLSELLETLQNLINDIDSQITSKYNN